MNFNGTLMAAAVAAGLAVSGSSAFAQKSEGETPKAAPTPNLEKVCDSIRVDVTRDTTGNIIMGYLANEQGINLGRQTSVATRNFTSVDRGYSNGKILNIVSRMRVQHAQHNFWTWNKKEADEMVAASDGKSVSISVKMTPNTQDYIFGPLKVSKNKTLEGDVLVVDAKSMAAEKEPFANFGKKLQTAYASKDCKVTFNPAETKKLDAYMDKKFGAEAQDVRDALRKTGADSKLVDEYDKMSTRQIMVRRVTPQAEMYADLKKKGIVVEDIVEVAKKGEDADKDRYVVQRRGPSEPKDYLCVGWTNPTKKTEKNPYGAFSANCWTPVEQGSWQLEIVGTQEALRKAVGADFYEEIEAKALPAREYVPSGTKRTAADDAENRLYAMERGSAMNLLGVLKKLSPLVEATNRAGIVSQGFNLYDNINDPNRELKKIGVQRVNATKQF